MEVNGRVNYPVKSCLVALQERGEIDLDCPHQKFCVSWFTIRVCNIGTTLAVQAWNEHPIPGAVKLTCMYFLGIDEGGLGYIKGKICKDTVSSPIGCSCT